jgi:hypothetical protein
LSSGGKVKQKTGIDKLNYYQNICTSRTKQYDNQKNNIVHDESRPVINSYKEYLNVKDETITLTVKTIIYMDDMKNLTY